MYGGEALQLLEHWDRGLKGLGLGFVGPCQLPGLRELGLDTLYEVGQMDSRLWRETWFGGNGQSGAAKSAEGVFAGPRDFWSVVM